MKEPIDIHPGRGGWMEGYPKSCNAGMPASINEDIRLDKCERVIPCVSGGRGEQS